MALAGLGTIWQAISLLIKYLPALIEAIQRGEDYIELRIEIRKIDEAIKTAKDKDDTRPLNDLLPK
jgi:hypothetical protein